MSNIQVTRLAAIQLVMMHASTSLMFSRAFTRPGIAPHRAPDRHPARKASTQITPTGTALEGMDRATIRVTMVEIRYWPGAPMLKRPVLKATATERPVMIRGVARNSMLPRFTALKPQVRVPAASRPVLKIPAKMMRMPSHAPLREIFSLHRPTIRTAMPPTRRPATMEIRDESTFLVPSFS